MISMPSTARPGRGPVCTWARPPGSRRLQPFHGLADGPPIGTGIAYTDFPVPHIAAVSGRGPDYRRCTGKGQYIDFGQMEAAIHGLGTAILDWTANASHEQARMGNRDPNAQAARLLPLPGRKADRHRLRDGGALERAQGGARPPRLVRSRTYAATRSRLRSRRKSTGTCRRGSKTRRDDEPAEVPVEGQEGIFVRRLTSRELMEHMHATACPPVSSQSAADVHHDPQLAHRKHFRKLEHLVMGLRSYDSPAFKLSKTPAELDEGRPLPRADNEYVYRELIGLAEDEFVELLADGAFEKLRVGQPQAQHHFAVRLTVPVGANPRLS